MVPTTSAISDTKKETRGKCIAKTETENFIGSLKKSFQSVTSQSGCVQGENCKNFAFTVTKDAQ